MKEKEAAFCLLFFKTFLNVFSGLEIWKKEQLNLSTQRHVH